jgi:hypothetical protein
MAQSHRHEILAASLYAAAAFAAGFVLGSLRVLLLAPALGEFAAVALELPVMLTISWVAFGVIAARLHLPHAIGTGLRIGIIAFVLLLLAEFVLGLTLFARAPAAILEGWLSASGLLGLAGQILFALIPPLRLRQQDVSA